MSSRSPAVADEPRTGAPRPPPGSRHPGPAGAGAGDGGRQDGRPGWADRGHFLAAAAQAMRRILVDHARRHLAARRGGGLRRVDLDSVTIAVEERAAALVALDDALGELAAIDARLGRVVECRFFSGLSEEETAEALRVTSRTVRRDWVKAKGWLLHALKE